MTCSQVILPTASLTDYLAAHVPLDKVSLVTNARNRCVPLASMNLWCGFADLACLRKGSV
jgi:hypothetical protein